MIGSRLRKSSVNSFKDQYRRIKVCGKSKVFGIGRNKTGTTSLKKAFLDHGYVVGSQANAEMLTKYYASKNYLPIISYCKYGQAFQDVPFSYPNLYKFLDLKFPSAKFILTIRDSAEQWYDSLVRFHSKKFGNGQTPSSQELKNANYVYKGWMWECNRLLYKSPENDPYKKDILIAHYNQHNQDVVNYFEDKPDKLLVINVAKDNSYQKFCKFLKIQPLYDHFPWENKT